ncbi:MAG: 4-hydroxythreonine-4-phosphate dehydrogenase PdxA [Rikenellaceae bacterium]|nr:4-hydroxythreonine-4-phosphate dehydrogenase PdxA [Rikenellaceae bacterium]MCL2692650.1 4-hydroxythreonine-4-phosphate dehydrogenase PdxA [Rikenellaceae bacterium]
MSEQIRVGITLGDTNGIGPEVVIKALMDSRMCELFTPVIYGSPGAIAYYKKLIEGAGEFRYTPVNSAAEARDKCVNLINCTEGNFSITPGVRTADSGRAACDSLEAVTRDIKADMLDVVVTAPVNKEGLRECGLDFAGQTEYFAAEFGGEPLMMMCSELLRVGLVTTHLALGDVNGMITCERIVEQIMRLRRSLVQDFGIVEPRIAVLALNPHSGDGGLLGAEEQTVIKPAIEDAIGKGALAFGPFPADGFFAAAGYRKYDAALAMYHDQGLAPFKALTPQGVNFTAGLPVIRTSPDHGVAYDIAGRGIADPASMREAIYLALDVFRTRRRYAGMTRNPLQRFERERSGKDLSVRDLIPETETED